MMRKNNINIYNHLSAYDIWSREYPAWNNDLKIMVNV